MELSLRFLTFPLNRKLIKNILVSLQNNISNVLFMFLFQAKIYFVFCFCYSSVPTHWLQLRGQLVQLNVYIICGLALLDMLKSSFKEFHDIQL